MRKKFLLKKNYWIIAFSLSITLFLITIILMININEHHKYVNKRQLLFDSWNTFKIDYKISPLKNSIYSQGTTPINHTYITKFIDSLQTTLNYSFQSSEITKTFGNYKIFVNLEGQDNINNSLKTIWQKTYSLKAKTTFSYQKSSFKLEVNEPIKIKKHYEYLLNLTKDYSLNFNHRLVVNWLFNISFKTKYGSINKKIQPHLIIPLSNSTMTIEGKLNKTKNWSLYKNKRILSPNYQSQITLLLTICLLAILSSLILLLFTEIKADMNKFAKHLKKMHKLYSNRIITTEFSKINKDPAKISIDILTINDMVKISDELRKPIIYYNGKIANTDCHFFNIFDNDYIYNFMINEQKFKSPMN